VPDAAVCAGDVAGGRPAPWMIYRCMEQLGAYPPESVVVIGDTIPDIEAGLNARVWSAGVAATGNMIGMSEQELEALDEAVIENMLDKATEKMFKAGAHYVGDGIDDCTAIVEEICDRLAEGEKP
jgi:phosphonoacetaldehyde hydrolase